MSEQNSSKQISSSSSLIGKVEGVTFKQNVQSKYAKITRMEYTQNGVKKNWDVVETHNAVTVLLYHSDKKCFLFVKQFRPPIYVRHQQMMKDEKQKDFVIKKGTDHGVTVELCAGLCDKTGIEAKKVCQEEIEEGSSGMLQHMYYAEVNDSQKVGNGGGIEEEGEMIEVIEVPVTEAIKFIYDETICTTPSLLFAVNWWFLNKKK